MQRNGIRLRFAKIQGEPNKINILLSTERLACSELLLSNLNNYLNIKCALFGGCILFRAAYTAR